MKFKSSTEIIERRLHQMARRKVRSCSQPGTVWNVIEGELQLMLAEIITQKLREEQEAMLGRSPYERGVDKRKRNGYKKVRLFGIFQKIPLRRPVMRGKTPPSPILCLIRRFSGGLTALLASRFWLRGASTRAVAQELNDAFGTKLSSSDVSEFSKQILPAVKDWMDKPIEYAVSYLYLDAAYLPVRKPGFTCKQALLCAIAITGEGKKKVLGYLLGDRENVDSWSLLLKNLLERGLDRNLIRLAISDEHKAIQSAVAQVLGVDHQLCVVHKMRNVLVRVAAKHRKAFYADFKAAFWAEDLSKALLALGALQAKWQGIYPKATSIACNNHESFLRFFNQPRSMWTILRSTNLIERFIREIRRRLRSAGAMQNDDELYKLLWDISVNQEKRWDRRGTCTTELLKKAA